MKSIEVVDRAAVVGNPAHRLKTRFPTSMRLTAGMPLYAREFEPERIDRMFETFRSWSIGQRAYSMDWVEAWFAWVDRQVEYDTERHHKEYWLAYFERRAGA
jgi:hypothetical protein